MVDRRGLIRTIAGGLDKFSAADGLPALEARLLCPDSLAVATDGTVYFADGRRSVRKLIPQVTEFPRAPSGGALHGATFLAGAVSPGMLLTIFGANLGSASIARGTITAGRLGVVAGATSVFFDGAPVPIIYASAGQLAVLAPYSLRPGSKTSITVEVDQARSTPVELDVVESRPGLFTADSSGKGQAAILNENGSVNSSTNPAAAGSIVVLFGTGEGQTSPAGVDGRITTGTALPRPILPVRVTICGEPAEILYAGAAPSSPAGVLQVNARVPTACAAVPNAEVRLVVGNASSPSGVTVAVR